MIHHIPGPAGRLEALVDNPAALCTTASVPERADPVPALPTRAAVVLAHPHPLYGGSMHTKVLFQVAKAFCRLNCAVLRFNFRGVGTSEGTFANGLGEVEDYWAALEFMAQRYPDVEIWAGGVSFGSWVGTTAGANDDRVSRLVAIAPPVTMYDFSSVARSTKPKFFINGERDEICPLHALREFYAHAEEPKDLVVIDAADHLIDGHVDDLAAPPFTGVRVVEEEIATLRPYIDWTFFFHAWELKGRYPAILDDPEKGAVARDLFGAANELLDRIAADGSLQARGVYGFWLASADGDDVVLDGARFPMLRQQADHADSRPNRSLADYVAPVDSGLTDHVGAFAVAIHGSEKLADRFAADLDDYHAIMVRALADRLAEAYAERLHEVARREWYAPEETLTNEERIGERFRGIRPAFGYPACPDHSEKGTLLPLLDAGRAGIGLTESYATTPGASVSGLYFGHPQARYFSVGRLGRDQVADYAKRKGITLAEGERWLRQNLAYEP
jgi:alpha/beta superfamily hydrolase